MRKLITKATSQKKCLTALLGAVMVTASLATDIPLTNPSLESPSYYNPNAQYPGWEGLNQSVSFTGWSMSGANRGASPVAHTGSQGLWSCWGAGWCGLLQNSSYTVLQAGEILTAGVWAKTDANVGPGGVWFRLALTLNNSEVALNQTNIAAGTDWTQITQTYTTTAADIGKTVGISFGMDGGANANNANYCFMDDASLSTSPSGAPTLNGTATPNPANLGDSVLFTVTVTNGTSPTINSVTLNAAPIGGSSSVTLVSAGGNVYTNRVTVAGATDFYNPFNLQASAVDALSQTGYANIAISVNPPTTLTWAGGTGNWTATNWLPYNAGGPRRTNQTAIVTNGTVTVDINGGVGNLAAINLAKGGVMLVNNARYASYGNILFQGGTLNTSDGGAYNAYGSAFLPAVTASGMTNSTIASTGGGWYNLNYPSATFTVSNGATLTVSGTLRGAAWAGYDDNLYQWSALVKAGGGNLVLSGANQYSGGTVVSAGTLSISNVAALVPTSSLTISNGATVNLGYAGTLTVEALVLGGVTQPAGTHGATGSGATHINNTYFTGAGVLNVVPPQTADGPGFPNVDYSPAMSGQVLLTYDTGKAISGVAMHRGYLMVPMGADHGGGQGAGAIAFYNISNVSSPTTVFDSRSFPAIYHSGGLSNYVGDFAEAHHVSISGNYVLNSERSGGSGGFSILDISPLYDSYTDTLPAVVSRYVYPGATVPSNYDVYSFAPAWQGSRYVFAPTGSGGLQVVDTTDFANPIRIKHLTRSELANLTLRSGVAIGNLLILSTSAVEPTFQALILDISDPANPQQIGSFSGALGYQGFVFGSSFYGGGKPLQRHDFSNPANVITTTLASGTSLDLLVNPEYGFGQDESIFIGHYPGSTKWLLTNNTAVFTTRVDSGLVDDHAFGTPLGNLVAVTTDHANTRKLMIGIHDTRKDTRPPLVNFTSPANGATNVNVKSRVGLCFTDFVEALSLNTNTLLVRKLGGPAIPGSYSSMQGIVNFVPAALLETNATYEVVLAANGVRDYAGNAATNETVVMQFATGAAINSFMTDFNQGPPVPVNSNVNLTLTVSNLTGLTLEHAWEFGDGTPLTAFSTATSTAHTYTNAGNFVVTIHTRIVGQTTVYKVTGVQVVHRVIPATPPVHSSSIVYDAANLRVWNVNPDNGTVTAIHATNYTKLSETPVGGNPKALALGPGNTLWVVNKSSASISVLNRANGAVLATHALPYASAPVGIVIHQTAARAYVSLEALGQVAELDTATGAILRTVNVGPWPRGLALDPIQGTLWVARFISPDDAGKVTAVNLGSFAVSNVVSLAMVNEPDTQTGGSGLPNYLGPLALAPDYSHLFVPAKKDNINRGILRNGLDLTFEHTMRSMATSIDLASATETPSRRLDLDNSDFATCVAYSPLGNQMFFAANGSATIWAVDAYTSQVGDAFTFGSGGMAPDGIAVSADGKRLFVHNFMSRTVTVFNSTVACGSVCGTTPLLATVSTVAAEALSPSVLRGKQLFYDSEDTRLSSDSYMSCASCHLDGGHDGRTWDFTGFGEGLRNTIDLNGRGAGHGPVHWTANFDEVHDFEGQIRHLGGGTGLMNDGDFYSGTVSQPLGQSKAGFSSDLDALAAYVGSLTSAGKSPHRQTNGNLTAAAAAGREIFRQQNCASCHSGAAFSDSASLARHDVGTLLPGSGQRLGGELDGLDTPTLRGLWKTAPYLHDGSAPTLLDVLVTKNIAGKHGWLFALNQTELNQLVAYLQQIDDLELVAPTNGVNAPPVLGAVGSQTTPVAQPFSLALSATDPNGNPLTYHALGLPPGLALDPQSGVISGAPGAAGIHTVHLTVRDSFGASDGETVTWTVPGSLTTLAAANFNTRRYARFVADSSVNGDVWTTMAEFNILHTNGSALNRSAWVVTADSQETSSEFAPASYAVDGVNGTFWHTRWSGGSVPAHPHQLVIDLGSPQPVGGFTYLPRQDNPNGRVKDWRFFLSDDGTNWSDPVLRGSFTNSAALQTVLFTPPVPGSITREYWTGISGNAVSALTGSASYPSYPAGTDFPVQSEGPTNFMDNYGTRMHGYLIPPATGSYRFWIASDDNSELWLSPNYDPASAQLIADVPVWTDPREWTKYTNQASAPVTLQAGALYYIRALQKEGGGGDNLAVAWQGPTLPGTNVISGAYLTPYVPATGNRPPVFAAGNYTFNVLENSSAGTSVGAVAATDPDNGAITFAIIGGNTGGAFAIHPGTGAITVQGALDHETRSRYDLTVRAQDNGNPIMAAAVSVTVNVGNALENNEEVVRLSMSQVGGPFPGHANPALVGFAADPDGDRRVNVFELLQGTDPAAPDQAGAVRFVPGLFAGQSWMAYELDLNASAADALRFHFHGSSNLLDWAELTNAPANILEAGGWRTYRVRDDVPLTNGGFRGMRLGISPAEGP